MGLVTMQVAVLQKLTLSLFYRPDGQYLLFTIAFTGVINEKMPEAMHYISCLYTLQSNPRKAVGCILDIGDPRKIFGLQQNQICFGTRPTNLHEHKNVVINCILNTQRLVSPHT